MEKVMEKVMMLMDKYITHPFPGTPWRLRLSQMRCNYTISIYKRREWNIPGDNCKPDLTADKIQLDSYSHSSTPLLHR